MHVECPQCQAVFDVPSERLRMVRQIRCGCCGHSWAPELPASSDVIQTVLHANHAESTEKSRFQDVLDGAEPMSETLDMAPSAQPSAEEESRVGEDHAEALPRHALKAPMQKMGLSPARTENIGSPRFWMIAWIVSLLVFVGIVVAVGLEYPSAIKALAHRAEHMAGRLFKIL